jgi:hypothetical protein
MQVDEQGTVTVVGHAPDGAVRAVVTLPDGRQYEPTASLCAQALQGVP